MQAVFFLQSFAQFVLVYNNIISLRLSCRHITAIITAVGQVGGSHDIRDDKQAINITLTKAMYDFWTCKIHVGETFEVLRLNSNKILISWTEFYEENQWEVRVLKIQEINFEICVQGFLCLTHRTFTWWKIVFNICPWIHPAFTLRKLCKWLIDTINKIVTPLSISPKYYFPISKPNNQLFPAWLT